uniref:Uncharacterized protein n=1 Tax=Arundo donax TaxID=35708 RepID=A0A0A8Z4V9_ARUDO
MPTALPSSEMTRSAPSTGTPSAALPWASWSNAKPIKPYLPWTGLGGNFWLPVLARTAIEWIRSTILCDG